MKIRFKKRIALFTTVAVAVITLSVFVVIYWVVYYSSNYTLNSNIRSEEREIAAGAEIRGDTLVIRKMPEAEEAEAQKMEVNPTFFQVANAKGAVVYRSPNLQQNNLSFDEANRKENYSSGLLYGKRLKQGQFPLYNEANKFLGSIVIGVSQEESYRVLRNLLLTLVIAFPLVVVLLYWVISYAASKAIAPVHRLIDTAAGINDTNIRTRVDLPEQEDEIYQLALTINELLNRIELHIYQQKQFTADAAHEMRTPLSAIRGHLEVLVRKPRTPEEYAEKIKEVLGYVDRLNSLFDQLLHLSSLEANATEANYQTINLKTFLETILLKWQREADRKKITTQVAVSPAFCLRVQPLLLEGMMNNVVSNALKYGKENGRIDVAWKEDVLTVEDDGTGIAAEHLPHLFNRFYRADAARSSVIPGTGLGLAVVKRLADIQGISVAISSKPGKGTTVGLTFPHALS